MKKRFIKTVAMLLATLSVVTFTACSKSGSAGSGSNAASTSYADMITVGLPGDPLYLDPNQPVGPSEITVTHEVYEGLVTLNPDGKTVEPSLAKDWTVSDDGLTYKFNLKPDLKFSDGTPVKGEDYIWSLLRARDCETSDYRYIAEAIKDVQADDKTVTITLKQQWAPFLMDLTTFNMVIGNKAYFDKVGETEYSQKPLGTGPYYLKEWKKGDSLLLEKNPYYHEAGLPKTSQVKFALIPDDNTRLMQLQSGQIDIMGDIPFSLANTVKNDQNLNLVTFKSTQIRYLILNTTQKPLDNIKVRQAIVLATDKKEIANLVTQTYGAPATSIVSESQGKWFNSDLKATEYDSAKAKQMLADAGYPNGINIKISVNSGSQVYQQIATVLKSQWAKAGINLNIELLEKATLSDTFQNLKHDTTLLQWIDDIMDPSGITGWTVQYDQAKSFYSGLNDKALDTLNSNASKEMDETKRIQMYWEVQQKVYDNANVIPLFRNDFVYGVSKKIQNLEVSPFSVMELKNIQKTK